MQQLLPELFFPGVLQFQQIFEIGDGSLVSFNLLPFFLEMKLLPPGFFFLVEVYHFVFLCEAGVGMDWGGNVGAAEYAEGGLILFLEEVVVHQYNLYFFSISLLRGGSYKGREKVSKNEGFQGGRILICKKTLYYGDLSSIYKDLFDFTMESTLLARSRALAESFLQFVNYSVSPYHAVDWCRNQLTTKGFTELHEVDNWTLTPGQKYFFTRNYTTIVAFTVGSAFDPKNTGFKVIGAHTDSPTLKLNPVSRLTNKGIDQCSVSTYGGGLWHTWFDRDLILAGRVVYEQEGKFRSDLWRSKDPLLKIPNLAIHLTKDRQKFEPSKEDHLKPVLDSVVLKKLLEQNLQQEGKIFSKHNAGIVKLISDELGISSSSIMDFDLYFADSNPSGFVGLNKDFISSPRLDNLFSSYHAIEALTEVENKGNFINIAALFDHEECGSESAQGAGSNILIQSLFRIYKLLTEGQNVASDGFEKTIQSSFLVSADMAHGIHPNYPEKHQSNHAVEINKGVVIKVNMNQRYATDLVSSTLMKAVADRVGVPISEFVVRNDSPCGSTIGPIIASKTGIKTIDLGAPMWGMHSIRETCGVLDGAYYRDLFNSFYTNFELIEHNLLRS